MNISLSTICLIVCHPSPADHFSVFIQDWKKKGYEVSVFAAGSALQKLQDRKIEGIVPFTIEENRSNQEIAKEIAKKCARASVVITDVGDPFDISLQSALAQEAPKTVRVAYYDNPECFVPGGYSKVASQVMRLAQGILFANANLASACIEEEKGKPVDFQSIRRWGIGYYPLDQVEKIIHRRECEQLELRKKLFPHTKQDQKIWIYAGGNNSEYFDQAFPAFLQFLSEACQKDDLSKHIILLQQHPRAKEKNLDGLLVQKWIEEQRQNPFAPKLKMSTMNTEDAQVVGDGIFYFQTSMAAQFALIGIPTIQVARVPYEDVLIKNQICPSVTSADSLVDSMKNIERSPSKEYQAKIYRDLGINLNWSKQFETIFQSISTNRD